MLAAALAVALAYRLAAGEGMLVSLAALDSPQRFSSSSSSSSFYSQHQTSHASQNAQPLYQREESFAPESSYGTGGLLNSIATSIIFSIAASVLLNMLLRGAAAAA